ncbi:hypothetical protein D3C71_1819670 [compost metagenome]
MEAFARFIASIIAPVKEAVTNMSGTISLAKLSTGCRVTTLDEIRPVMLFFRMPACCSGRLRDLTRLSSMVSLT